MSCVPHGGAKFSSSNESKRVMSVFIAALTLSLVAPLTPATAALEQKSLAVDKAEYSKNHVIFISNKEEVHEVNIPAQALAPALKKLHKQTGVHFVFPADYVKNLETQGVSGFYTKDEALKQLLNGSGLSYVDAGDGIKSIQVQVAQAGEEILLDGITVYGEKVERDLQETTSSVQVFTQQDIEDTTVQNFKDIIEQTANVSTRNSSGFTIRGIAFDNVAGGGDAPLASIYVDGAILSNTSVRNSAIENLWDVQQLEVLRGPQSTTQGRNTLAGAIVVKTNDPVYEKQLAVRGGLETEDGGLFSAMINAPIIDDKLAVRISADFRKSDGFNRNITLNKDDIDSESNVDLRGKVLFEPSKDFKNLITVSYSKRREGENFVDDLDPFARLSFGNIETSRETDNLSTVLDSEITLNDNWSIKNLTSFSATELDSLRGLNASRTFEQSDISQSDAKQTSDIFTEELRLHYKDNKLKAHVGVYYSNDKRTEDLNAIARSSDAQLREGFLDVLTPGDLAGLAFFGFGVDDLVGLYSGLTTSALNQEDVKADNYAAFTEFSFDYSTFLTIFGGLRYDVYREERKNRFNRNEFSNIAALANPNSCFHPALVAACTGINGGINGLFANIDPGTRKSDSDALLPSIGVNLNWTEDLATGFSVKRGFRAGGGGITPINGTVFDYDSEFVWNYELSLRSQWFDKKLTVNANAFFLDWTDQQVSVREDINSGLSSIPGLDNNRIENAGRSEVRGFEIEAFAQPTDELSLRGSVGYTETEFKEFTNNGVNFAGNEFPFAPEWTLSGSAHYMFANGIYLHGNVNYQSEVFSDARNSQDRVLDARTIVNAKVGYKKDNIDAYVFATNLFDEEYLESVSGSTSTVITGAGQAFGVRVNMKLD